ncbi:MAG TPA: hypothetical protein VHM30_01895, partial [Gemmatimonadaceae bacterium]|nr:hypothetical protein [Gemmatimonadaceae bacterium]
MATRREQQPSIHPEYLAGAAVEARSRGRFWTSVHREALDERRPAGGRGARRWRDEAVAKAGFDPYFPLLLAAMRECRLVKPPRPGKGGDQYPAEWVERYVRRDGRQAVADCKAAGVRDDLDAWWWIVQHAEPMLVLDRAKLDVPTLFSVMNGPTFATLKYTMPASVVTWAKQKSARKDTVVAAPGSDGHEWGMILFAAPTLAGELAADSVRHERRSAEELEQMARLDTAILGVMEATTLWTQGTGPRGFEKLLLSTLRRAERYPTIPRDAIRGLAAAEGVAIAEGRGPETPRDDMAALIAGNIREIVAKADPLDAKTVELAVRAVKAVADAKVCERTRWKSEEARGQWRAEVEGLAKRLEAARAARRVRASAPNAKPLPPLREIPPRPTKWREVFLHTLLDDAVAFLGALREHTGARPMALLTDGEFRELATDWDVREVLGNLLGDPCELRKPKSWGEEITGLPVTVWWPDVSPRPTSRQTEKGWVTDGWGFARFVFCGAKPDRALRSAWTYPTGTELRESKFAGPGPWRDVDWKMLRRKVAQVAKLIGGALGG